MKVQIILLSHNRPEWISETIQSILDQSYTDFELLVSENSTDERVADLLAERFSKVKIVKRRPFLKGVDHWNQVLSEVKSPYFMAFHDDDILAKDGLEKLVHAMDQNPKLSAVAGNGWLVRNKFFTGKLFNASVKADLLIDSAQEMGERYFNPRKGVNPFPGYLYRKEAFNGIYFDAKEAGKYSDVTLLMKLLAFGPILWLSEPTMSYRIHASNDSNSMDLKGILALVRSARKISKDSTRTFWSEDFRVRAYARWLLLQGFSKFKSDHPFRFRVILKFLFSFLFQHPLRTVQLVFGTPLRRLWRRLAS